MNVRKLSKLATIPTKAHASDAGFDLYSTISIDLERDKFIDVGQNEYELSYELLPTAVKIPLDIAIELPVNSVGLILPRSSMNVRGIHTHTGVIDEGYRGNIAVVLTNVGGRHIEHISRGDKIAQLVILPRIDVTMIEVETLNETERNEKGFGSSGR